VVPEVPVFPHACKVIPAARPKPNHAHFMSASKPAVQPYKRHADVGRRCAATFAQQRQEVSPTVWRLFFICPVDISSVRSVL